MILNSLLLVLLSNAITSRREKSILYPRVWISILLISALISYDNLSLLFLAKGIGIFGGLFHVTPTTILFHIFLITGLVLLLFLFDKYYIYETDFVLFITSPTNIALLTTSFYVMYFILRFFYNILLSEDSIIICAYIFTFFTDYQCLDSDGFSMYKGNYQWFNLDDYLTNKMNRNNPTEVEYYSSGSDPAEGRVESYRKMVPEGKQGGFTPINVKEEIYDINDTKIQTIFYERVTANGESKLKIHKIEYFDENGNYFKTRTYQTPGYLVKKN